VADVFISYKREDRNVAQLLADLLHSEGFTVWWDKGIRAGEYWDERIDAELRAAKAVVVLWSRAAMQSKWVKAEAITAFTREVLVSTTLDDVELRFPFNVVEAADLRGDITQAHPGFVKLLDGIRSRTRRRRRKAKTPNFQDEQKTSEHRQSPDASWSTGLEDVDSFVGRLSAGQLIVVAGRPSMGKSAFALSIATGVAKQSQESGSHAAVGFFTLESSAEEVATRMLALYCGISPYRIARDQLSKDEYQRMVDTAELLQQIPLHVDERVPDVDEIERDVQALADRNGVALVVIDSARMVGGGLESDARSIAVRLKALAKRVGAPFLVTVDVSRRAESRQDMRPLINDIDEAWEDVADLVVCLHRPRVYLEREEPRLGTDEHIAWMRKVDELHGAADLLVLKQRHGPTGVVHLFFDPQTLAFATLRERT
jgi:replicative DNA helicase